MQAVLFALFITSASIVFLLSQRRKPKYSLAAVSWLLLVLLVITLRSQ